MEEALTDTIEVIESEFFVVQIYSFKVNNLEKFEPKKHLFWLTISS